MSLVALFRGNQHPARRLERLAHIELPALTPAAAVLTSELGRRRPCTTLLAPPIQSNLDADVGIGEELLDVSKRGAVGRDDDEVAIVRHCAWWAEQGSNLRPQPCKGDLLTFYDAQLALRCHAMLP